MSVRVFAQTWEKDEQAFYVWGERWGVEELKAESAVREESGRDANEKQDKSLELLKFLSNATLKMQLIKS